MWAVVLCFGLLFALTFVLFSVWALCFFWLAFADWIRFGVWRLEQTLD